MYRGSLLAALVAASLGAVAAPAMAAQVGVSINVGPPAMRYEAVPEPRRGYQRAPGYWNWNGNRQRHHWVAIRAVMPRPASTRTRTSIRIG